MDQDQSKLVLVVDDDDGISMVVGQALSFLGFKHIIASSAIEGLQELEKKHPDLILLDHCMPSHDGQWFLEKLHEDAKKIPVVVMTALDKSEPTLNHPGIRSVLRKPFTIDALMSAVERALAH